MNHSLRRIAAGVLLASFTGCTTVGPVQSPTKYIAQKQPRTIWLTRSNHQVVRVSGPRLVNDTVVGAVNGQYTEIPLSDVTRVVAVQSAPGKTIAVAALGGVAMVAGLVWIFSHGQGGTGTPINQFDTTTL